MKLSAIMQLIILRFNLINLRNVVVGFVWPKYANGQDESWPDRTP